jgi:DNA-binding IclR family transcriptional regulator
VLDLMRRVHPEPVAPRHAMEATGLSETTVHRLLRKWEDEGLVSHVGRGAYQLARDPALV